MVGQPFDKQASASLPLHTDRQTYRPTADRPNRCTSTTSSIEQTDRQTDRERETDLKSKSRTDRFTVTHTQLDKPKGVGDEDGGRRPAMWQDVQAHELLRVCVPARLHPQMVEAVKVGT